MAQPTGMERTTEQGPDSAASRSLVQAFLDRLARALTSGDGETLAFLWQTPSYVLGDHDLRVVATPDDVRAFFGAAKDQYNARGITGTRADVQALDWLTERIAVVRVRWPYLDARGEEVGEETSTYTLRRDDSGQLKLCVAVMHGAQTKH